MISRNSSFLFFLKREILQLFGKKSVNLWVLGCIFFIALLSIGLGSASIQYLTQKMSDPFVTCVDIVVDQVKSKGYDELQEFIHAGTKGDSIQKKYGFSNPEDVYFLGQKFCDSLAIPKQLDGRSIHVSSPIFKTTILASNNVVAQREEPILDETFGIILSKEALRQLGYSSSIPSILTQRVMVDGKEHLFGVPVLAVVKELPDMCDVLLTMNYVSQYVTDEADRFDVSQPKYNKDLQICCSDSSVAVLQQELSQISQINTPDVEPYLESWSAEWTSMRIRTKYDMPTGYYDSLFNALNNITPIIRIYTFPYNTGTISRNPDLYSCYFEPDSLQYRIEAFSSELDKKLNYKLDMNKVNNLRNLAHVQHMGKTTAFCIMCIAMIFIAVFLYFLLTMHFQKIQRNIGTFKAFGVDNTSLLQIYLLIMVVLILLAYCGAYVCAFILQLIINQIWPLTDNATTFQQIDIFVWQNGCLLCVAILVAVVSSLWVVLSLLRHTPGDLIYERNTR